MKSMFQGMALSGLENAINRALSLDPATAAKLANLDGAQFALQFQEPDLSLGVGIANQRLQLLDSRGAGQAKTRLKGRWSEFAAIAMADDPGSALINGGVQVQGSTEQLLALRKILAELDLDWEQPLAEAFGDVVGHQLGKGLRAGQHWLSSGRKSLKRQAEEFLLEESRLIPHPIEAEQFFNDIDQLRSRSERLEARIRRLQQSLGPASPSHRNS